MMKLVSSWSHYLDFQCNDCDEVTHVDAIRNFPTTVACRSSECRASPQQREAVAVCDRFVWVAMPAGHRGVQQPSPAGPQ